MTAFERDPERPDPARPSRQTVRETLIERLIREAMDEGEFEDLPYQGARLPLEDDTAAGEWALAFRMLRNAGGAPPWIEADKEVRALLARRDALLGRAQVAPRSSRPRMRSELGAIVAEIDRAIARLNMEAPTDRQRRTPLDPDVEAERLESALREADRRSGS